MNQFAKYRQNAAECYEAARLLSEHREKAKMLAIAQSWISLAALVERNRHLEGTTTGLTGHGNGNSAPSTWRDATRRAPDGEHSPTRQGSQK
jgi:hypothetical protein